MHSKIVISESICRDEVIGYLASRYSISPRQVIRHFMRQEGILNDVSADNSTMISFEKNEMDILRDMGIQPSLVEFADINN